MTESDLREIGVTALGARRKILLSIAGDILYFFKYILSFNYKQITYITFFIFKFVFYTKMEFKRSTKIYIFRQILKCYACE